MLTSTSAERIAPIEQSHFWFVGRDLLVDRLLDRYCSAGTILDLGCGTGAFARHLASTGRRTVAADAQLGLGFVEPALPIIADAEQLGLDGGVFGVVLARDLLEHVDDKRALAECRRVLAPGGLLIALVPGWPSLWSARDEQAGHRRRYRRSSLRALLHSAGFQILELRGYQMLLLPLVAYSRLRCRHRRTQQLEDEQSPSPQLNHLFTAINSFEANLARYSPIRPPTGSSLVVVAQRT